MQSLCSCASRSCMQPSTPVLDQASCAGRTCMPRASARFASTSSPGGEAPDRVNAGLLRLLEKTSLNSLACGPHVSVSELHGGVW